MGNWMARGFERNAPSGPRFARRPSAHPLRLWVALVVLPPVLVGQVSGCGKRLPEPIGGHTGSPHIGWVIMSGDVENPDRDFACQSEPRTECVIPADKPEARVLGDVHLYYHAAAVETKYTGAIQIGHFDRPHAINPSIVVSPGSTPASQSVSDFVSRVPGTYTMSIDIIATSKTGERLNIREDIRVVVR